jgi:hypothetical protein
LPRRWRRGRGRNKGWYNIGRRAMAINHLLWEKIIPRVIASVAFAYLVYALTWGDEVLSYLHVIIFALVVVLVLAPFARRLKIPSVIDFESKLESLRGETKKEIGEIKNQISTTLESHVTPVQHQWNVIGMEGPLVQELAKSITKELKQITPTKTGKDNKDKRNRFLRRVDTYRAEAFDILTMAYYMHLAMSEQRPFDKDKDVLTGSNDEKVDYMINHLLDGGIESFVIPSETKKPLRACRLSELFWKSVGKWMRNSWRHLISRKQKSCLIS